MAIFTTSDSNSVSNHIPASRLPRLCVAVQGSTTGELLSRARQAAQANPLVELRLDTLADPMASLQPLRELVHSLPGVLFLATCRRAEAGGQFQGTAESEWNILCQAAEAGCALADLSVQTAELLRPEQVQALRALCTLLLSWHDFEVTPDLESVFAGMLRFPADVYKLVPTATGFEDNARLLQFVERHSRKHALVAFCMSEMGLPSRVLSLRAGAVFTFASLPGEAGTAPGQVDLATMRELFHADGLTDTTRVYGVLGYPLGHSLSPLMQNRAFREHGLDAVYLPLASPEPGPVFAAADVLGLEGFSVTIPHKSSILPMLHEIDPLAKQVGAVNTVVRSPGGIRGYNTDVDGIIKPLEERMPLRGARVLVVGAGGAARAAAFGLVMKGAGVALFNRTRENAAALAREAGAEVIGDRAELRRREFDIIINTTPVGQYPKMGVSPLEEEELRAGILFDLVYNPLETELVKRARQAGLTVIPGVEMFIHQGARQFELWTGQPAPVDQMRHVVMDFLFAREKSRL